MRKPWIYVRAGRPGVYVYWYGDDGRQHAKRLPNKTVAEQYRRQLEYAMNTDLFVDPITKTLDDLIAEYVKYKVEVKHLAHNSIVSIEDALRLFHRFCGPRASTRIDKTLIARYVAHRANGGSAAGTINKDLRQLRAFVRWALKNKYMGKDAKEIDWGDLHQREAKKPVRALSIDELVRILRAAKELYGEPWYIRVILAVATGLRKQDIEAMHPSDFHSDDTLTSKSRKTGKSLGSRPLHPIAGQIVRDYIQRLPPEQTKLFDAQYDWYAWKAIQERAGVTVKFHDLRRTFASFILQAGFSTSVAQGLLEHSTPNLTHDVYANLNPVYRQAVSSIPFEQVIDSGESLRPTLDAATPEHPTSDT